MANQMEHHPTLTDFVPGFLDLYPLNCLRSRARRRIAAVLGCATICWRSGFDIEPSDPADNAPHLVARRVSSDRDAPKVSGER